MIRRAWHFHLHIYIAALFLVLIVAFSIASMTVEYFKSREVILAQADARFRDIEAEVSNSIEDRYGYAVFAADLLSDSIVTGASTLSERLNFLEMFSQVLRDQPKLSSLSIGYDTGDYFSVYRLVPDLPLVQLLKPPAATTFLVQSVERSGSEPAVTQYLFFDDALTKIGEETVRENPIDPRTRPWFAQAMNNKNAIITVPYAFFTTNEIGTTIAKHGHHGRSVIRINVTLINLSRFLREVRPTPSAKVAIVDQQGQVLAASDFSDEELAEPVTAADPGRFAERHGTVLANAIAAAQHKTSMKVFSLKDQQGGVWYGSASRLDIPQAALYLAIVAPEEEVLADVIHMRNRNLAIAFGQMLVLIVLTLGFSRLASRPLNELTREAAEIRALKFEAPTRIRSIITEIDVLARTMATMKSTIQRFLEMGVALASERNFERLLKLLLVESMEIATARGGAVYLSEPEGNLKCPLALWDGGHELHPADVQPERDADHPINKALTGGALVYEPSAAELSHWYPEIVGRDAPGLIAVALRNRQGVVIGAMLLFQDRDTRGVQEREVLALVEGLPGTAAVAIERQLLLLEQKRLFEGLIELVANAIDRKSPYTGGHCRRVPELVQMIARAAAAATSGPFKDFALSEEQWETLHIAGWLHDCGKVTTPEYVVDKATKLETIYDRLHEVRMRFEVLKREAEVACWQAIAAGESSATQLSALREQWDALDEEFAFVAECNEGGEFMAPEKVERLRRIANRTWTRTLDDRIGLSPDEQERRASSATLPAVEPLLADKPEHIFVRQPRDSLAPDNPWGFKFPPPEHLYNRGEIHNLVVSRGTLSEEERYKINEHMVETIRMLHAYHGPDTSTR